MTDGVSITDSSVVRKLQDGELLECTGPMVTNEDIDRIPIKALRDNVCGWASVKGNAGTEFLRKSTKHYVVKKDVLLTKMFKSSDEGTKLEAGTLVEMLDETTKAEKFMPVSKIKARVLGEKVAGWVRTGTDVLRPWSGAYNNGKEQALQEGKEMDAKELRKLAANEKVEHVEGPVEVELEVEVGEGEEKKKITKTIMRLRVRAEKDNVIGWVTLRDGNGKPALRAAAASSMGKPPAQAVSMPMALNDSSGKPVLSLNKKK
jgi:hypothetical protein